MMNKKTSIKYNGDTYIVKSQYDYDLYELRLNKDKEIERLKAREQECIDKYLAESKYRGEVEGKYVFAKYVIDELEKWLKEQKDFIEEMNYIQTIKEIKMEHKIMINDYNNVLDKLKELKEGDKDE